jgi:hypothetical protein
VMYIRAPHLRPCGSTYSLFKFIALLSMMCMTKYVERIPYLAMAEVCLPFLALAKNSSLLTNKVWLVPYVALQLLLLAAPVKYFAAGLLYPRVIYEKREKVDQNRLSPDPSPERVLAGHSDPGAPSPAPPSPSPAPPSPFPAPPPKPTVAGRTDPSPSPTPTSPPAYPTSTPLPRQRLTLEAAAVARLAAKQRRRGGRGLAMGEVGVGDMPKRQ